MLSVDIRLGEVIIIRFFGPESGIERYEQGRSHGLSLAQRRTSSVKLAWSRVSANAVSHSELSTQLNMTLPSICSALNSLGLPLASEDQSLSYFLDVGFLDVGRAKLCMKLHPYIN